MTKEPNDPSLTNSHDRTKRYWSRLIELELLPLLMTISETASPVDKRMAVPISIKLFLKPYVDTQGRPPQSRQSQWLEMVGEILSQSKGNPWKRDVTQSITHKTLTTQDKEGPQNWWKK